MFVAGNFISALAQVIDVVLQIYMWIIIARALLSWVNPDPYNAIVQFLYKATEPVLYPIRRATGSFGSGLDLSPMIVILAIMFLKSFVVASLYGLASRLR
ncbi:MAG: YggT family protein [Nitrospiria bacterium]